MSILVTGGAGYIGSHTVRALQRRGKRVIVLDNLVYGSRRIVEDVLKAPLIVGQVGDQELLRRILRGKHPATKDDPVKAVLHFAAYAYVRESVEDPCMYYRNNTGDSLSLLECLKEEGERRKERPIPLIFSSTCASYGIPEDLEIPIKEECPQKPINPYGRSKLMIEHMIEDFAAAYALPNVIFRYFNAAGADPAGDIGENHVPETHLIPLVLDALSDQRPYLEIFGDKYPTHDGTCIRDYVHVMDLADAHVLGLELLLEEAGSHVFNIGNGKGYSVKQVIELARDVTEKEIVTKIGPPREGEPPILIASAEKIYRELGWKPRYQDLRTMIEDAWRWHQVLQKSRSTN